VVVSLLLSPVVLTVSPVSTPQVVTHGAGSRWWLYQCGVGIVISLVIHPMSSCLYGWGLVGLVAISCGLFGWLACFMVVLGCGPFCVTACGVNHGWNNDNDRKVKEENVNDDRKGGGVHNDKFGRLHEVFTVPPKSDRLCSDTQTILGLYLEFAQTFFG
jgi:hypothetical protein